MAQQSQIIDSLVAEITTSSERVAKTDVHAFSRTEELGTTFDLQPAIPMLVETIELVKLLTYIQLPRVSQQGLTSVKQQLGAVITWLDNAAKFQPAGDQNAQATRDNIINQIFSLRNSTYQAIAPIVAFEHLRVREFSALTEPNVVTELRVSIINELAAMTKLKEELAIRLAALNDSSESSTVRLNDLLKTKGAAFD